MPPRCMLSQLYPLLLLLCCSSCPSFAFENLCRCVFLLLCHVFVLVLFSKKLPGRHFSTLPQTLYLTVF